MVEDLGSLNGTFIGTRRVKEDICPFGELLTIGPLTIRVEAPDADPPGVAWCGREEFSEKICDPSTFGAAMPYLDDAGEDTPPDERGGGAS